MYSQDGKLKSGALVITITDKLTEYDKEFDDHVKNYNNFRKNAVNKFFESPIVVTPSLLDIKSFIDNQKTTNDVVDKFFEGIKSRDITKSFYNINN